MEDRIAEVLKDIDLCEVLKGNQEEVYKLYLQNCGLIKSCVYKFCRNELNYDYQDVQDLINEIYSNLHLLNYSNYKRFCFGLWRVMYSYYRIAKKEQNMARLDAMISHEHSKPIYEVAKFTHEESKSVSSERTVNKLVKWLSENLPYQEFKYTYLRYIEFATDDEILKAFGYSLFNREDFFERNDFKVCQTLREKTADMCSVVGGVFEKYALILPSLIEKRKQCMQSFKLR